MPGQKTEWHGCMGRNCQNKIFAPTRRFCSKKCRDSVRYHRRKALEAAENKRRPRAFAGIR
jgi:hypothetical protein